MPVFRNPAGNVLEACPASVVDAISKCWAKRPEKNAWPSPSRACVRAAFPSTSVVVVAATVRSSPAPPFARFSLVATTTPRKSPSCPATPCSVTAPRACASPARLAAKSARTRATADASPVAASASVFCAALATLASNRALRSASRSGVSVPREASVTTSFARLVRAASLLELP